MPNEHFRDIVARARDNMLSQFNIDETQLTAFFDTLAAEVQEVEDAIVQARFDATLSRAAGVHLDTWGEIVGEPRNGLLDPDYRRFITARILTNNSEGEIWRLVKITQLLTGTEDVYFVTHRTAHVCLTFFVDSPLDSAVSQRVLRQLYEAVVGGVSITLVEALPGSLRFGSTAGSEVLGVGVFSRVIQ